jgi:hypothetical protein
MALFMTSQHWRNVNQITMIPADGPFRFLTRLRKLDLSYNQITSLLDKPFDQLTQLEFLSLSNNVIMRLGIDALVNLANVIQISMDGNPIQIANDPDRMHAGMLIEPADCECRGLGLFDDRMNLRLLSNVIRVEDSSVVENSLVVVWCSF